MTDMRWRGQQHETLYNWINSGDGARAATPQLEYWEGLKGSLGDISQRLNDSLNKIGASWEGKAGDSAHRGLTPMRQWADTAQHAADSMRQAAQDQADNVSSARAKMPEPVPKPHGGPMGWPQEGAAPPGQGQPANPAAAVAMHGKDFEAVERASADSAERAVQVMNHYQAASEHNAGNLAQFFAPPSIEIEVGDTVVSGGAVHGFGGPAAGLHQHAAGAPGAQERTEAAGFAPTPPAAAAAGGPPAAPQPHAPVAPAGGAPSYTEGAASTLGASAALGAVGSQFAPRLSPGGFTGAAMGRGGSNRGEDQERTPRAPKPAAATENATNVSSAAPGQQGTGQPGGQPGGAPVAPGMGGGGAGGLGGDTTRGGNPYLANRGLTGGSPNTSGFDPLGEQPAPGGHTGAGPQPGAGQHPGPGQQAPAHAEQSPAHQQPHTGAGYGAPDMGSPAGGGGMPPANPGMGAGGAAGAGGGEEVHHNSFLVEADNVFDDDAMRVAPPVIGED